MLFRSIPKPEQPQPKAKPESKPKLSVMDMFKHKTKTEAKPTPTPAPVKDKVFDPDALYQDLMKDIPKGASLTERMEADKKAQWARLDAKQQRGVVEDTKPKLTITDDVYQEPPAKKTDDDVDNLLKDLLGKL